MAAPGTSKTSGVGTSAKVWLAVNCTTLSVSIASIVSLTVTTLPARPQVGQQAESLHRSDQVEGSTPGNSTTQWSSSSSGDGLQHGRGAQT